MTNIIEELFYKFHDTLKMSIFNKIKTGNHVVDTIINTFIFTIIGYIFNHLNKNKISLYFGIDKEKIKSFFYKRYEIELEGKRSCTTSIYSHSTNISATYSNRFKAFWFYIVNNISENNSIYKLKETVTNIDAYVSTSDDCNKKITDILMVSQSDCFIIDDDIYAICKMFNEDDSNNDRVTTKIEKITVKIYSYKFNASYLTKFIDNITADYLTSIKTNRYNKKFIYTLEKTTRGEDDSKYSCWSETNFISCRKFSNMFFEGKTDLIKKIDFFINNRNWYESKGIPWTCGIGLYGEPGTGKTSFIKALGNYTGYHLVFLSLKLIKTKQQLHHFFFEDKYNNNNEKKSITFDKKITVIEDIDCIGDIVLKRSEKFKKKNNAHSNSNSNGNSNDYLNGKGADDLVKLGDIVKSVVDLNGSEILKMSPHTDGPTSEEPITLDDLLNIWDGVRETPGRILIITSNHYDQLDPALIRPGRIDITHEFKNASHDVISEMYNHLFNTDICDESLSKINEYFYSPAEIINIYLSHKTKEAFVERLLQNVKP